MYMLYRKAHLSEVIKQFIFIEVVFVSILILFSSCLYLLVDVSSICVIHHDTKLTLLSFVNFSESTNIGVV